MSNTEIWLSVTDYDGYYMISDRGRLKTSPRTIIRNGVESNIKGRILKGTTSNEGYTIYTLCKESSRKVFRAHRLVYDTFIGIDEGFVVDHIDNIPSNNNIRNLQAITQRENCTKDRVSKSRLSGAHYIKNRGNWRSSIMIEGSIKYLGVFDNEFDAHKCYINYIEENI